MTVALPPGLRPLLLAVWLSLGTAAAHQSLLFAHLTTDPAIPIPGESFELRVHLTDSSHDDVTGVDLVALLSEDEDSSTNGESDIGAHQLARAAPLRAAEGSGLYTGPLAAREAGEYRLTLIEVVDGESEATASVPLAVGGNEPVDAQALLPPSGQGGLGTWLVWLIGLPLLAGLLVTVLILTSRGAQGED